MFFKRKREKLKDNQKLSNPDNYIFSPDFLSGLQKVNSEKYSLLKMTGGVYNRFRFSFEKTKELFHEYEVIIKDLIEQEIKHIEKLKIKRNDSEEILKLFGKLISISEKQKEIINQAFLVSLRSRDNIIELVWRLFSKESSLISDCRKREYKFIHSYDKKQEDFFTDKRGFLEKRFGSEEVERIIVFCYLINKRTGLLNNDTFPLFVKFYGKIKKNLDLSQIDNYIKHVHGFEQYLFQLICISALINLFIKVKMTLKEALQFIVKGVRTVKYFFDLGDSFGFVEEIIKLAIKENITIFYGIDRSGRGINNLLFYVLKNLGIAKGKKFYFILGTQEGKVLMYSEKQKEELINKNVLVIDEYVASGRTITSIRDYLKQYVGNGQVFTAVYSCAHTRRVRCNISITGRESLGRESSFYWASDKEKGIFKVGPIDPESGIQTPTSVGVYKDHSEAIIFRKNLKKLAKLITEYLKKKGY